MNAAPVINRPVVRTPNATEPALSWGVSDGEAIGKAVGEDESLASVVAESRLVLKVLLAHFLPQVQLHNPEHVLSIRLITLLHLGIGGALPDVDAAHGYEGRIPG